MNIDSNAPSAIEQIGCLLRLRREEFGISQKDLAELSGLSVHTISDVELAKGNPTLDVIQRISECLGMELELRPKKLH